jgi:hypothetical protein
MFSFYFGAAHKELEDSELRTTIQKIVSERVTEDMECETCPVRKQLNVIF